MYHEQRWMETEEFQLPGKFIFMHPVTIKDLYKLHTKCILLLNMIFIYILDHHKLCCKFVQQYISCGNIDIIKSVLCRYRHDFTVHALNKKRGSLSEISISI